jgi:hypothetical protein
LADQVNESIIASVPQEPSLACSPVPGLTETPTHIRICTMTMAFLAQPEQQQTLEWLDGGTFSVLLDSEATNGQLTVGRFAVGKGEAAPFHVHTREDEIFKSDVASTGDLWF